MVTKVLLATASPEVREHLGHVFAESDQFELAASVPDGAGVLTALDRNPDVGIVVIDEAADDGHGHALARTVGLATPLIGIVMVVDAHGPAEMNKAMAAAMEVGARSVISRNAGLEEVLTRFEAVASWSTVARAAIAAERNGGRGGQVVVVAGAKGGVGTSVLALLLARAGRSGDTTLVDFDLGAGDLAAYAGVRTRRSVVDLAGVEGEVTARMLRETTYEVGGGLRLLTAPNDGERGEDMTPAAARSIVSALRFESNLAVLDVGAHLDEPRATAIEFADRVLLVTTPDLPALRAARRVIAQWDRLAIRRPAAVELVLNRRSSRDEVTPQLAERIVERPSPSPCRTAVPRSPARSTPRRCWRRPRPCTRPSPRSVSRRSARERAAQSDDPAEVTALVARSARRNGRSGSEQKSSDRRASHEKSADPEAGQSTVELPVVILIALTVFLLCAQGIAWAGGLLTARAVAQEGARTVGIEGYYDRYGNPRDDVIDRVRDDARDQLPGWMGSIDDSDIDVLADRVSVRVTMSTVFPGVDLSASSSATVYQEG